MAPDFSPGSRMEFLGPEGRQQLKTGTRISAVGLELAMSVVICASIGAWLDARWSSGPWATYVGLGLGLIAGLRSLYRFVRKTNLDAM